MKIGKYTSCDQYWSPSKDYYGCRIVARLFSSIFLLFTSVSCFDRSRITLLIAPASGLWLVELSSSFIYFLKISFWSSVSLDLFLKFKYLPHMNLSFLEFCRRNSFILFEICLIWGSYFGTALARFRSFLLVLAYKSLVLSFFVLFCFKRLNNSCTCCCFTFFGSLIW